MQDDLQYFKFHYQAKNMLERSDDFETIEKKLIDMGAHTELIAFILKQLKEEYARKRHTRGLTVLLTGMIILLISFVLTCINFHANESITYVMFGISSVGLIVIFFGLYDLFG